jgi:hypothetical protein
MTLARARSLIVIGVLAVLAITSVTWAIAQDGQAGTIADKCKRTTSGPPPPPNSVKLRVLNATNKDGLAGTVARELRKAGFTVVALGNETRAVESSAEVRFGPKGLNSAALVRAYVRGAETVQQDNRKDAIVDLVLGDGYEEAGITPANQVKRELEQLGPLELETDLDC